MTVTHHILGDTLTVRNVYRHHDDALGWLHYTKFENIFSSDFNVVSALAHQPTYQTQANVYTYCVDTLSASHPVHGRGGRGVLLQTVWVSV